MSINGASAALTLSDIPWNGPVGRYSVVWELVVIFSVKIIVILNVW